MAVVCRISVAEGPSAHQRFMLFLPQCQVCAGKWTLSHGQKPLAVLVLGSTPVEGEGGKEAEWAKGV